MPAARLHKHRRQLDLAAYPVAIPVAIAQDIGVQKTMFWTFFTVLSLLADFYFSFMWGLILTIPLLILSWYLAYRTGWFD